MNWGEIKTAVRHYLENDETTFVGNLPLYARLAEEDIYRSVQLTTGKELATATVFEGDRYITPPDRILSVYSFSILDPVTNAHIILQPKEFSYLKEVYPDPDDPNEYGVPRFYCWRDDEALMIAPTPNGNYGLEMHYFAQPELSIGKDDNDANSTWLSESGQNAIIFGVIYHGYINEKGDQDVIAAYKGQFDKAIQDLKVIFEGRNKTDSYRMAV